MLAYDPSEKTPSSPCVLSDRVPAGDGLVELAGFRGTLDHIGLATLLCVLEMERKTGVLVLILDRELDQANLYFSEGRVFRAHLSRREKPCNAELVYRLLARTRGVFDFRPTGVVFDDEMHCSTAWLLFEGARRIDEARRAPQTARAFVKPGAPSVLNVRKVRL